MTTALTLTLFCSVLLFAILRTSNIYRAHRRLPLPPGPRPWPIIGNALQISMDYLHHTFKQWGLRYGDVVHISILGRTTIVLNSLTAAQDLLEKRSGIYPDRPRSILIHEMMDFSPNMPLLPYNDEWRRQRRMIQASLLDKAKLSSYRPLQQREVARLLAGLLETPEAYASLIRRYTGGIMLEIAYGRTVNDNDERFIELESNAIMQLTEAGSPSASLVDFIPALRYMPTWLPGSGWKRKALEVRELMREAMTVPYEETKQAVIDGTAGPSFLTTLLEETMEGGRLSAEDERTLRGISSVLYAAGTDTTVAAILTFVLAMVLHPEVCHKAQQEVDRVIGHSRLPNLEDRDSLPYMECILRETYRWNTPLPIGIPHRAMEEDTYRGFYIPKQAIVIANLWHIARDPDVYADPEAFVPERYLDMDAANLEKNDPRKFVFGFGRRFCPGRQLADSSVWLAMASMLAVFNFETARDAMGRELSPPAEFISGAVSHPKPFLCRLSPRSQKMAELVYELASAEHLPCKAQKAVQT